MPLFQRKYCWNEPQIKQLFEDVRNFKDEHRMGNIILISKKIWFEKTTPANQDHLDEAQKLQIESEKPKDYVFFCVDGQQRILSLSIFLASLKHLVDEQIAELETHSKNISQLKQLKTDLQAMSSKVEVFLFGEISTDKENDRKILNLSQKQIAETINSLPDGKRLEFLRFLPSFFDRKAFYQATTLKIEILKQEIAKNPESVHLILKNRLLFDNLLRNCLKFENPSANGDKSNVVANFKTNFDFLSNILETLLERLSFIMFKVVSREDCQVVYQQLYLVFAFFSQNFLQKISKIIFSGLSNVESYDKHIIQSRSSNRSRFNRNGSLQELSFGLFP